MAKKSYASQREDMIHWQLIRRGVVDKRLLDVMEKIPRHLFVPPNCRENAYEDRPLPIGDSQTISQPYVVGLMTSLLALQGTETVLEIGTGSGYQTAILARMAKLVHSVERILALARQAQATLHQIGIGNVIIHPGDGSLGWPDAAPYQAIIVTAAAPSVPKPLLEQLADDGRLVIPVGTRYRQSLELWKREGEDYTHRGVLPVTFVPLIGKQGWADDKWR